jgi:hypothetical protein
MKSMNCKPDLYHSTIPKTACIDIGQLLSSIPASPSLHSELFKVDDTLIAEIYNVVEKILRNPPLYAWFDSNYRTAERTFTIQVVDDIAYVDVIADCTVAVNRYKIKDFITQLPTGRWEPDLEAIKNIKIYYDVYS